MHVELAPRRREAVAASGRRTGGVVRGGEEGPAHGCGAEGVQVVEVVCGRGVGGKWVSGWRGDEPVELSRPAGARWGMEASG